MKTIGLLGGTGWSSTIDYYRILNMRVHDRLGGHHSAKILLKSIDYHDIVSNYGIDDRKVAALLKEELKGLAELNPDSLIICCNSLHKFYDMIKEDLDLPMPVFHAVELTAQHIKKQKYKKVLLLATKFTMEDGFFQKILERHGIEVVIPVSDERVEVQRFLDQLIENVITEEAKEYFRSLIQKYEDCDAVVLGCTELPLAIKDETSALPIIDPVHLQCEAAVEYSLGSID